MNRITEKKIEQISKKLDMDAIGIKIRSQRPKDVLNEMQLLVPFHYIFKRENNSIYYHVIPNYRRKLHESIPRNATESEIDINRQLDKLIYKDLSILTLIYLLRKDISLTQKRLCQIDNNYHDMIIELINEKQPDISMVIDIYPQIPSQSLYSYLNVLTAARKASALVCTNKNQEPKIYEFIVEVRNLLMDMYPSLRGINQKIIKIKKGMQEHQNRIQCEQDEMPKNEQRMREILSSYFQSYSPGIPKSDTIIIDTRDIQNRIALDYKYTKSESNYLSTRDMITELQGLFSVEYLILYSFYVEIMPHINIYFAFKIQSEHWQTFLHAVKTELYASTNKMTDSTVNAPAHLPKNSHGITYLLSNGETNKWINQLLIAPMQSSNLSPANILINHRLPTKNHNTESASQHEQLIQSNIDNLEVMEMTACVQAIVQALSKQSRILMEKLNNANEIIIKQQHIIDTNCENSNETISLDEHNNLLRELNRTKQQLKYQQQQYSNLSKELAPYENLKLKSQELQNQLDMQVEINSKIEEQLENVIEHQSDIECKYDEDAFVEFLKQQNVFIVGGHEHWRGNMQLILPNAKIVAPEHNNASVDNAKNADYIIINTSMLNHPMFRKVRAAYQSNSKGQMLYLNTQASNISRTLQRLHSQIKSITPTYRSGSL